ncbi:MAG: Trk system potassium transporter TrkA [Lachnospiraceae bacterium]|nr:Trk system potassium transporter TrkA [Lachnospiraceae bacterium]
MKILIAGNGKVGSMVTRQLSNENCDLTLIDRNKQVLESCMEHYDVMGIQGNCASMDTLLDAGVKDADLLIAMTGQDEINLLCCLTAHFMNPKLHTIVRIRNPEYVNQIYSMRSDFAISMAVNPDRQAATEIYKLLRYPGFLKRDTFVRGNAEIVELRIKEHSQMAGLPLTKLNSLFKTQVLVCAVLRDGEAFIPAGHFMLEAGDRVFVTGASENLSKLLRNTGIIARRARRVLIAGASRISYYLAQNLLSGGVSVQILEKDPDRCRDMCVLLPDASIVKGDASDQQILNEEGIRNCDAFVTMTGEDETNIVMSIYGTHIGVPQVITKLGRAENVHMLDDLPIGSIVSPKELCSNTIVRYVRAMQNQEGAAVTIHMIADGQVEAIEFIVDESTLHCGEPLKEVPIKKDVLLASISRDGKTEIAGGDSRFYPGDSLVVVSAGRGAIRQLNDIFERQYS